jgi:Na+-driven multidrug efflux pump
MAIGAAVSAMAAQNIGAGRWDRVDQIMRSGVMVNLALTGGLLALLTLVDRAALGLLSTDRAPRSRLRSTSIWSRDGRSSCSG